MSALASPRPVLVTRPPGRGDALLARLADVGITAEHHPFQRLVPAPEAELDAVRALLAGGTCTHLVVTSPTVVEVLGAVQVPAGTDVVAVGEGTAAALRTAGIPVTLVAGGSGAALVQEMPPAGPGASVLFPASAAAARTVPDGLRAKGYRVQEVPVYRPEQLDLPAAVTTGLPTGRYAALVLTSPQIARRAAELGVHPGTGIVTIGAPTSAAVRQAGLPVGRQADSPDDAALARAVQQVLARLSDPAARPAAPPPSIRLPKESR